MRELTKAQITVGLLSYFSTVVLPLMEESTDIFYKIGVIILQLILILILSYVVLAILEWMRLFDIKINAILTFQFLVVFVYLTYFVNLI